jgi:hypothetical protein
MAADPSYTERNYNRLPNTDLANAGTGSASGQDYLWAQTTVQGSYEIINMAESTVSSITTTFPTWQETYVSLTAQADMNIQVVNATSGATASSLPGHWAITDTNASGGYDEVGSIYTLSTATTYLPVTATTVQNQYKLPNGTLINAPQTLSTGQQQYVLMNQQAPWPAGISANTSGTIPGAMNPVWADLMTIIDAQGANGVGAPITPANTVV